LGCWFGLLVWVAGLGCWFGLLGWGCWFGERPAREAGARYKSRPSWVAFKMLLLGCDSRRGAVAKGHPARESAFWVGLVRRPFPRERSLEPGRARRPFPRFTCRKICRRNLISEASYTCWRGKVGAFLCKANLPEVDNPVNARLLAG
jgi:hypothetical protein